MFDGRLGLSYSLTFGFVLLSSVLHFSVTAVLKAPRDSLVDCGWSGITEELCLQRKLGKFTTLGCVFNTSTNPQCYHKHDSICIMSDEDEEGDGALSSDCGSNAISRESCEAKGCCYDERRRARRFSPCFHPKTSQCFFSPHERKDCGFSGITRAECELKKCCFDPKSRGPVPQCFLSRVPPTPVSSPVGFSLYLMFAALLLVIYWTYGGNNNNNNNNSATSTIASTLASFFDGSTPTEVKTEKYIL